ncbi:alpha-L-rhamnosidase [Kocuria sp.]|uniref:alpha-L-rhamnosidase n=1 Tax=Kocuria sp. TaxID=1871328 RepID=UPI0026DEDC54|nr:alpha-L-rhamnosidase [Kocuria sp.]MDO5618512.1 family 78 glycoside hydrolase catalytic domain [Kocuria sp.]
MTETVTRVRLEHHEPGRLGVGETTPRISWQVQTEDPQYRQAAARLEVTRSLAGGAPTTQVHELQGPDQVLVAWPQDPLSSRERVTVRVQVSEGSRWSPWSEPVTLEIGLLEPAQWSARFVGPAWEETPATLRRPGRIRTDFTLPADIVQARLYLTGHGLVQAEINGERIGDEELTPGWTSYHHRLRYATFDVTEEVTEGSNAIGIWLADGWHRGRIGFEGGVWDLYGSRLAALAQLEILTADGSVITVGTDESWQAGFGPLLSSSLYDGEHHDQRLEDKNWSRPEYLVDPSGVAAEERWGPVAVVDADLGLLEAPVGPPVRCTGELNPVTVEDKGEGRWLLDFGQNHSGRLRIKVSGVAGQQITLRHAEVIQDGELYTRTLRQAEATDVLILGQDGPNGVTWEPRFTIHGYRYAEISGVPGTLNPADVVSRVLHTDMERTGWFRCSEPILERLHENVLWSTRSNFVDIPTDCPQRDERLGWTGDIQVFAPAAAFLYDVTSMLDSWLRDVALEQQDQGTVPVFVPYMRLGPWGQMDPLPTAVWGDVAVLTPDVLHQRTGDLDLVRRQYPSAKDWVDGVLEKAGDSRICEGWMQLGDWLDPAAPPEEPFKATTDPDLVATAYLAWSTGRLSALAELLGHHDDAATYAAIADEVREAFAQRYIGEDGTATSDTQCAYALISVFELYPDARTRAAGSARLAQLVREAGGKISTGFAGTPVVTDALTRDGYLEEAYLMLQATENPSWLYPVSMGATTIWERWDSMLPDGSINPGEMTSFNHYALGAVADWMQRVVAGLALEDTAYRRIRIAPRPGGTLTSAGATHNTPYGQASVDWEIRDGQLHTRVVLPVGTSGVVDLPGQARVEVGHGRHEFTTPHG